MINYARLIESIVNEDGGQRLDWQSYGLNSFKALLPTKTTSGETRYFILEKTPTGYSLYLSLDGIGKNKVTLTSYGDDLEMAKSQAEEFLVKGARSIRRAASKLRGLAVEPMDAPIDEPEIEPETNALDNDFISIPRNVIENALNQWRSDWSRDTVYFSLRSALKKRVGQGKMVLILLPAISPPINGKDYVEYNKGDETLDIYKESLIDLNVDIDIYNENDFVIVKQGAMFIVYPASFRNQ